jgi:hypothetical protein
MAGIALSIILEKPNKTYQGGETITGQVKVKVTEEIKAAALVLALFCKGFAEVKNIKKTIEKEMEEINLFKGSWMPGEYIYPFEFVAPSGPQTYKGHIFNLSWHVTARVCTSPEEERRVDAEIILLPGKQVPVTKTSEEAVYKQVTSRSIGCFAISLIIISVGTYIVWKALVAEQESFDLLFFGGVIPILLGSVVFFLAAYNALVSKRIKMAEVRLGTRQISLGEKIPVSLTFETNISFEVDKITATLRANEIVDFFSSSTNKMYRKHCLYESKQELPLAVKRIPTKVPIRVEGEVVIPEGVQPSMDMMESSKGMAIKWEIEFAIEMKRWPDWIHFEDIIVQQ